MNGLCTWEKAAENSSLSTRTAYPVRLAALTFISRPALSVQGLSLQLSKGHCHALPSLPRNPPIRPRRTREGDFPLFQRSVSDECRAEVIITHAPSTSEVCETHAQHVEKSIASPAPSALLTFTLNGLPSPAREIDHSDPPSIPSLIHSVGLPIEYVKQPRFLSQIHKRVTLAWIIPGPFFYRQIHTTSAEDLKW